MAKIPTYIPNPFAEENGFLQMPQEKAPLPSYEAVRDRLPKPFWMDHPATIACYWKTWEIAFRNLRQPVPGTRFVSNFIDTAFNDCIFMWDTTFIEMFTRYGSRAFNFQRTLDNFYACQHPDGFICREIYEPDSEDHFERFDPVSTGPNVMPWAEWEYYLSFGDKERLKRVFPPLVAYYQWFRQYRTWPDGSYWSSGWGCGMDNQPRLLNQPSWQYVSFCPDGMTWVDTCLQQVLAARLLLQMADALGRGEEVRDLKDEAELLSRFVNHHLWDDSQAFYFDRWRDGCLSGVKTIGAYWALLAGVVPAGRLRRFTDHLHNPAEFNRPHRVPSLSANTPGYSPEGTYWLGGVWAPTNYMVLRGLTQVGQDDLAYEIAVNHLDNVVEVFRNTGTVWENYAPESASQGNIAKPDFVGWTGLPPVAVFFEYLLGIQPDVPHGCLRWEVRQIEEHGIRDYPYGEGGLVDLSCARRNSEMDEPEISLRSNVPVDVLVKWKGGSKTLKIASGE